MRKHRAGVAFPIDGGRGTSQGEIGDLAAKKCTTNSMDISHGGSMGLLLHSLKCRLVHEVSLTNSLILLNGEISKHPGERTFLPEACQSSHSEKRGGSVIALYMTSQKHFT
jgi:hypothetical protein